MKNINKTTLAVLAAGLVSSSLFTQQAQALPIITGNIGFTGSVAFDTTFLAAATQVNVWRNIFETPGFLNVGARSGSFLLVAPGADATFNAPWVLGSGLSPLWSLDPFTFNLDTSTVIDRTASELVVLGIGRMSATGFADTVASWAFTAQSAGGARESFITVSANDVAGAVPVPDGGSTATLLGIGLGVIAFIRRKLRLCA